MKLHWSPRSPYVRKVMVCAHELGLLDRIERVRSVAAMLKPNPQLMQDNPLSKIPTLVCDDGQTLFDSAVICEYLDDLAGGTLVPRQGPARWATLRWQAFGNGLLDVLILWRNEREREQPLKPLMDAFEVKALAALAQLERETADLKAAPLNLGQITIACALGYLDFRFSHWAWRTEVPALAAWYGEFAQRDSMRATQAAEG
jgi:glutathione S-transferase